jgi:hypothetical protein
MRTFRWMIALAALGLAACGGGSTACNGSFGGSNCPAAGGTSGVAVIQVTSDLATIPGDGSTLANITATAKDANNNAVSGITLTFSSSTGSVVVTSAKTDASGHATATLSGSGVTAGTAITVTAASGTVNGMATVTVANTQRTLSLVTSLPQVPSDGSKSAIISALVRDSSNNVIPGVTVSFASSSGSIAVTRAVTDATGTATANLNAGTDPTNRSITVTATAGTATMQLQVNVRGTTLSVTASPNSLVLGAASQVTAQLKNSAGQGIPGVTIGLTSALGNTIAAVSATTDVNGQATFSATAAVGGKDTLTASGLGESQQTTITVSTQTFTISSPTNNTKVNLGQTQLVTAAWLTSGTANVGAAVTFTTSRGTITGTNPVNTDANGQAAVTLSSTSAGPAIVTASGTGVNAQVTLDFVAVTPSQISVQLSPATVGLGGTSVIQATVRDAANNLVEGASVDFLIVTDPTNGGLSAASVVTNSQGIAQTNYIAGNSSSGANGVRVSATVHGTAITANTTLTVGGQAVFLSLGTGNTVDTSQGVAIYQVTYSVFAVDASGAPVPNAPISLAILPVAYGKGYMACVANAWVPNYTTTSSDAFAYNSQKLCRNEDTDYTGNINSLGTIGGIPVKDYNVNGKLDPGNVPVVAPGSGVTNASGRLDVTITYPRDHSYWYAATLVASSTVNGTQSSTTATFVLAGASADYNNCLVAPPGPVSPYGQAATCANPN